MSVYSINENNFVVRSTIGTSLLKNSFSLCVQAGHYVLSVIIYVTHYTRHKGSHQKYTKTIHNNIVYIGTYNPRHYNHHAIYKSTQVFDYYTAYYVCKTMFLHIVHIPNVDTTNMYFHLSLYYSLYPICCIYYVHIIIVIKLINFKLKRILRKKF